MSELDVELPRVAVKRIIKAKLAEHQAQAGTSGQREFQVNKDALTAFSQATKVFITYVTTAANDICRENKRSTVAPQDILQALQELDFPSFMPALEERLQGAALQATVRMCTLVAARQPKCVFWHCTSAVATAPHSGVCMH